MCFSSTQSSMSYKKIPKLPQLSWCLVYTMIWYHCSPLVSCRFLRCKASVPTRHPLCPPAPWALDLHPWWCHHCHLCPMEWQLQPQRPWNPKQGNNTVVWGGWGLGSWVVLRSKGWGNRNGMKFVFLEFLHKHVGMDLLWNWGHG